MFQGPISGAQGDRGAEAGVVHQILLLLSTNTQKHKQSTDRIIEMDVAIRSVLYPEIRSPDCRAVFYFSACFPLKGEIIRDINTNVSLK